MKAEAHRKGFGSSTDMIDSNGCNEKALTHEYQTQFVEITQRQGARRRRGRYRPSLWLEFDADPRAVRDHLDRVGGVPGHPRLPDPVAAYSRGINPDARVELDYEVSVRSSMRD